MTKTFGSVEWEGNGTIIPASVLWAEFAITCVIYVILSKVISFFWLRRKDVQALQNPGKKAAMLTNYNIS